MKKYLKENLKLIVVLLVFIVLAFGFFIAYNAIFVNNQSKYGDRLDGIENVKITDKIKKEIVDNVGSLQITKSVSVNVSGKTINVLAKVNDDIDVGKAKEIDGKVIEKLSEEAKKFYDIQILISKDTDDAKFPIVGYRHHSKDYISWTKDR